MAQTPCVFVSGDQDPVDHVSTALQKAGDIVMVGARALICISANQAIGDLISLATEGVWRVPKPNVAIAAGDTIGWDPAGNPVKGTAGSGAGHTSAVGNAILGFAVAAALATDPYVVVSVTIAAATAAGVS